MSLPEAGSSTLQLDLQQQKMHQAAQWPQVTHCSACLHFEATGTAGRQSIPALGSEPKAKKSPGCKAQCRFLAMITENRTKSPPRYRVKPQTCQHPCCSTLALPRHWAAAWLEVFRPLACTQSQGSSAEQAGRWASPVWAAGSVAVPESRWEMLQAQVPGKQVSPGPWEAGQPCSLKALAAGDLLSTAVAPLQG